MMSIRLAGRSWQMLTLALSEALYGTPIKPFMVVTEHDTFIPVLMTLT